MIGSKKLLCCIRILISDLHFYATNGVGIKRIHLDGVLILHICIEAG